jgi:signal peptidase II
MSRRARREAVTGLRRRARRNVHSRRGRRRYATVSLALVSGVFALDQVTKVWAVSELSHRSISVIGDTVQFQLGRNTGSAFSLFQGFTPLLAVLAIAVAFVLARAARRSDDLVTVCALSLVLGGSLGNLADRLFRAPGFLHGAVIDFIRLGWWPTFNVADSAITIGALLLALFGWRAPRRVEDTTSSP